MKRSNYFIFIVFSTLILPSIIIPNIAYTPTQGYAEDVKIGFSWINGLIGASETIDAGYVKAVDMGCQIEHREYRWDYLNYSLSSLFEWYELYLKRYPNLEKSLDISVLSSNSSAIPYQHNFKPYTILPTNNTRFNDTAVVNSLRNTTMLAMNILDLDYISFSTEINGYFETYYNTTTESMDNTVMLMDFVDLLEQMYDFIKVNYTDTKVLTNFRYQPPSDLDIIESMIHLFNDTCDIFSISPRIFTDDYGFLAQPDELAVLDRFSSFANLTDKKIAITNTYTISDSRAGSSEFYQSNYINYLFNFIELYDSQIEFVCWYSIFDYPPGYLSTYFSPLLEVHATAGLFTPSGNPKMSYYAWIEEMRAAGKLPSYWKAWKIGVGSLVFAAVLGFIVYAYVMEGMPQMKQRLKKEEEEQPDKISFDDKKKKTRKRTKKPKTIEFTTEGFDINQENDVDETSIDEIEENNDDS